MNKTSMILSSLIFVSMVIMMAPSVIAMNHGKILRNIALWLAIFLGLALFYQAFGPESKNPLFSTPDALKTSDKLMKNDSSDTESDPDKKGVPSDKEEQNN